MSFLMDTGRTSRFAATALIAIVAAVFALVFGGAVTPGHTLFSLDAAPVYPSDFRGDALKSMMGSGYWLPHVIGGPQASTAVHPTRMLLLFLPPLAWRIAVYVVNCFLLMLGMTVFLRGRGVRRGPAWLAGLAMGFSGYSFTLISAGHMGNFGMTPYVMFTLAFIDRALTRKSFLHYAWAGVFAAFGLVSQPDVMGLFGIMIVGYGLLRFVSIVRTVGMKAVLPRTTVGGLLALAVCLMTFASSTTWLSRMVETRAGMSERTAGGKWEYCTNWSMPPEEILEFVAPCVYGVETGSQRGPYWGRLGRSMGWAPGKPGLMNYRQHTVYLGVLQLLFALYVVFRCVRRRDDVDGSSTAPEAVYCSPRAEVIFWALAAVLSVLLAMGRYFPLYRLFFLIPGAARIRCPVKFLHLTEVAVCILFGYGIDRFASDVLARGDIWRRSRRVFSAFSIGALSVGTVLFATALVIGSSPSVLVGYWRELGFGAHTELLARTMKSAFLHGGVLFIVGGLVFLAARIRDRIGRATSAMLVGVVVLVVAGDLTIVSRKYINTRDVRAYYAPNHIADRILEDQNQGRTSYYLSRRTKLDSLWANFYCHNVDMLEPRQDLAVPLRDAEQHFFQALQSNPFRLWQLTSTQFIVGALTQLKPLLAKPSFELVERFDIAGDRIVQGAHGGGVAALIRYRDTLPRISVLHNWLAMTDEKALSMLSSSDWDPSRTALVPEGTPPPAPANAEIGASVATVLKYEKRELTVHVELKHAGLLLVNDRFDPTWCATVNGAPVPILKCNYLMRGVMLPAGANDVEMRYRPSRISHGVTYLALFGMLIWTGISVWRKRRSRQMRKGVHALMSEP